MTAPPNLPIAAGPLASGVQRVEYRGSYWKTTTAAAVVVGISALSIFVLAPLLWAQFDGWSAALRLALVALLAACAGLFVTAAMILSGGVIVLRRDRLEAAGRPYIQRRPREVRPNFVSSVVRVPFRLLGSAVRLAFVLVSRSKYVASTRFCRRLDPDGNSTDCCSRRRWRHTAVNARLSIGESTNSTTGFIAQASSACTTRCNWTVPVQR